jgi:hypothetical protein
MVVRVYVVKYFAEFIGTVLCDEAFYVFSLTWIDDVD